MKWIGSVAYRSQRIETKALARVRSKSLTSRSLGLDTALGAYSTGARFLDLFQGVVLNGPGGAGADGLPGP